VEKGDSDARSNCEQFRERFVAFTTLLMNATRSLIVNGDDFGLSPQVNAGILQAHQHGILTDASLMVTGPAWREAVELARATPTLSVGLHVTLVQGKSVLPPHLLSALTDFGGNFPNDATLAGLRYFFSRRAREQVYEECRAQIERVLSTGLTLTHIDGHVNIHMHPVVSDALIALMQEYDIPAMRVTNEDPKIAVAFDARQRVRKLREAFIFSHLARRVTRKLQAARRAFPDALRVGRLMSGICCTSYRTSRPASRNSIVIRRCCPARKSRGGRRPIVVRMNSRL
jgi:chitin disaccharide deacetylase